MRGAGGGVVIVRHVYVWWWGRLLFELANGPLVLPNLFNLPSRPQYILLREKKHIVAIVRQARGKHTDTYDANLSLAFF